MSSAICFNLDQSKILSSGNGLSDNLLGTMHYEDDILSDRLIILISFLANMGDAHRNVT